MTCWVVVTTSVINLAATVTYIGTYASQAEAQAEASSRFGATILTITLPPMAMTAAPTAD